MRKRAALLGLRLVGLRCASVVSVVSVPGIAEGAMETGAIVMASGVTGAMGGEMVSGATVAVGMSCRHLITSRWCLGLGRWIRRIS